MLLVWLRGRQRISYSGQVVSRYVEVRLQPAGVEGDSAGIGSRSRCPYQSHILCSAYVNVIGLPSFGVATGVSVYTPTPNLT